MQTFLFQFVNSYSSLFYIAFAKTNNFGGDYCHDMSNFDETGQMIRARNLDTNPFCLDELATQLTSLVIFGQVSPVHTPLGTTLNMYACYRVNY